MHGIKSAKDIRVGIVGFGMGQHHAKEMAKVGITVAAVCDKDPARLESARTLLPGVATFQTLSAMLKNAAINMCIVATPHNTHCNLVCQCLNAKKNVVVEKPMAITGAECDKMIATAKKNRVLLTVYHNRHWDGVVKQMVQVIKKDKAVGEIVRIEVHSSGYYGGPGPEWRANKKISGGIMYDWGAHLTEYIFQIVESPVVEVMGMGHVGFWNATSPWGKDSIEDDMNTVVRFKNGQWLLMNFSLIDSFAKNEERGWIEVTGTEGTYIMQPGGWRLIKHGGGRKTVTYGHEMPDSQIDFYHNLIDHMVKGKPLAVTAELGRRVIMVLDLADQSFKKGRAIQATF